MKIRQTTLITILLLFASVVACMGADCPSCGAVGVSALAMLCPDCSANMHDPIYRNPRETRSSLKIRLLYTGEKPEKLPGYGKLYINGTYKGNIDLIEKQTPENQGNLVWQNGLGKDFSAFYEKTVEAVPAGVLKIEVEMKFDRMFGLGRSYKRVVFPYVAFKEGEKTVVEHVFNSASTFHKYKPGVAKKIPLVSDAKIQGASGTVALNVPLF